MDLNIKNKVVIVTGGGRGIGEAICRLLAAEGAVPVIVGRLKEEGEALARDIEKQGGKALAIQKELGTPESCREVVEETLSGLGRIDALVNNAGANDGVGLEHGTPAAFVASLEKNLFHYFNLAHFALPELKKNKGVILNISSKTALTGQGNTSAYVAAKGAILALTREWAVELLKYGIRVNAIVPAEVITPLYHEWVSQFDNPEEKLREIGSRIPLGNRLTTPEEIADTAVFLLSDRASHVTAQYLFVDGGYVHLDRSVSVLAQK
ncbi:MAG: SDR family oxidoreductase [Lewinella sp.]|nr:SDR family oxidoreductase [Lewinella sp.]